MAIRSSFFNSINGDRKYDASRFAEYFNSFIGNGVFPMPTDGLQVVSNDDMTVTVKLGKAWINGYMMTNTDDYILNIDVADGVLNRIDRVVARYGVGERDIWLEVKKGTFDSNPVAPTLQRDADAYELGIADILVNNGVVSINQGDITDLRSNSEFCGKVDSLIAGDINSLAASLNEHKTEDNPHGISKLTIGLGDVLDVKQATKLEFDEHLADNTQHGWAWKKINEIKLQEDVAQLDIDIDILSDYNEIMIVGIDTKTTASGYSLKLQLNDDNTNSYYYTQVSGGSVASVGTQLYFKASGAFAPANGKSGFTLTLKDLGEMKNITFLSSRDTASAAAFIFGAWANSAKIRRVNISNESSSNNLKAGSTFEIWGR